MRTGDYSSIGKFLEGEELSARKMNRMVHAATPHRTGRSVYIDGSGVYERSEPFWMDERWFELKNDFKPTDTSVTAYLRAWTGSDWETNTNIEFEVYDPAKTHVSGGVYYGRGKASWSSPHDFGSIGRAVLDPDSSRWLIRELTPHATEIKGLLTAAMTDPPPAYEEIDYVVILQPTGAIICPDQLAGGDTYVGVTGAGYIRCENDWFEMMGDNNAPVISLWNMVDANWRFKQVKCPV